MDREIKIEELDRYARSLLGVPYRYGVEVSYKDGIPSAIDCSELIEFVLSRFGLPVPDGSWCQYSWCIPLPKDDEPPAGSLGFMSKLVYRSEYNPLGVYHVGLVLPRHVVIEAYGKPINKVVETDLTIFRNRVGFDTWARIPGVTFVWPSGKPVSW